MKRSLLIPSRLALQVFALLLAACTDSQTDAKLTADPAVAKVWSIASAPSLLSYAELGAATNQTDNCPIITKSPDGTQMTVEGGCRIVEPDDGETFDLTGKIVATIDPATMKATSVEYLAWGWDGAGTCKNGQPGTSRVRYDGTFSELADGSFSIDLRDDMSIPDDNCINHPLTLVTSYDGTVSPPFNVDGPRTWNGRGRVTVLGDHAGAGTADVETINELTDYDQCANESMSGVTRIRANGHTIELAYDGATDCDDTSTVRWSFDGVDQGEIEGVSCGAGHPLGYLAVVLVLLFVSRVSRKLHKLAGRTDLSGRATCTTCD